MDIAIALASSRALFLGGAAADLITRGSAPANPITKKGIVAARNAKGASCVS